MCELLHKCFGGGDAALDRVGDAVSQEPIAGDGDAAVVRGEVIDADGCAGEGVSPAVGVGIDQDRAEAELAEGIEEGGLKEFGRFVLFELKVPGGPGC